MRNASLTSTHFIGWLLILAFGVGIGALAQDGNDPRRQALEAAYDAGYMEGHSAGYDEGYAVGRSSTTMCVENPSE